MKKIRYGMIGGGRDAFIGGVHRIAAALDQQIELVCGAFSSTPQKSLDSGADLGLPADRRYGSFEEMIAAEAALPADERMQFVSIVTPNHVHFPAAKLALESGFHVLSDKPATLTLGEAKELAAIVKKTGQLYGVTYNYTGYPLVREARDIVRSGKLGKIRKIVAEYPQGWLATMLEAQGQKQAGWRCDVARGGEAGCIGDIGTHAISLAEYVTGLRVAELAADLTKFLGSEGREVYDDGNVLLRFEGGARGVLHASQISVGCENNLALRVYGEKGGIEWHQLGHAAKAATRTPSGHPEGYLEAFAVLYRNFANHVRAVETGSDHPVLDDYPTIEDGLSGMRFIAATLASAEQNAAWVNPSTL